ncbi:MAG: glycine--tRNA ligase subunit beta, partial [Deltaproteobacteria bacterium]|nr:glycine--tRNA ligase subunit beta [Deltaproteobacteria bacterium]
MSARDLLLEIGTEEIPAGFLPPAHSALREIATEGLGRARLSFGEVSTFATPRRLVLVVRGVAERQEDVTEERVGPAVAAAYDAQGNPTKAAQGFARSQGVDVTELLRVDTEKGAYVAARRHVAGRPASELLAELLPEWLGRIPFRKSMRWGSGEATFARPVHWVLALLGGEVIPFSFAGIESGRTSRGHRFHSPGLLEVAGPEDYFRKLEAASVVVDAAARKKSIAEQVERAAAACGGKVLPDEE